MTAPENRIVPLRPTGGVFDFRTAPPFAANYLRTYYEQPPTADETLVSHFLVRELARRPPSGVFIELGCGPTVHHVFPFAPYVREVHMADYLEDNLAAVRLWKGSAPQAHDWSPYAALTLRHEGRSKTPEAVAEREALARAKIAQVSSCDLKHPIPGLRQGRYDAVGCFYCIEEVGVTLAEWRRVLANAAAYLRPGGTFYMAALVGMESYAVRDASGVEFAYPCAPITRADVEAALPELGFPPAGIVLETSSIEHPDCGVTAALVVAAVKAG